MKGVGLHLPRATIGVSRWRRFRAAVDWPLILTIIALCAIGLLNLYSATRGVRNQAKFEAQVQWMVVGAIAFVVMTVIDYRTLVRLAWGGLGFAVVLLILARLLGASGDDTHGDTYRWIHLAGMRLQPSELCKVMVILVLARIFSDGQESSYTPRLLAIRLGVFMIPIVLIAAQPDLGTAVLLTLLILTVGYFAMPNV